MLSHLESSHCHVQPGAAHSTEYILSLFLAPRGHLPHSGRIPHFCKHCLKSVSFCTTSQQSWWQQVTCRAAQESVLERGRVGAGVCWREGGKVKLRGRKTGGRNTGGCYRSRQAGGQDCDSVQDKRVNHVQGLGKHMAAFCTHGGSLQRTPGQF